MPAFTPRHLWPKDLNSRLPDCWSNTEVSFALPPNFILSIALTNFIILALTPFPVLSSSPDLKTFSIATSSCSVLIDSNVWTICTFLSISLFFISILSFVSSTAVCFLISAVCLIASCSRDLKWFNICV